MFVLPVRQLNLPAEIFKNKIGKIKEELADVAIYSILLADACGLDLDEIIQTKIRKNEEKYPIELAYGKKDKYTELKK